MKKYLFFLKKLWRNLRRKPLENFQSNPWKIIKEILRDWRSLEKNKRKIFKEIVGEIPKKMFLNFIEETLEEFIKKF